MLTFQELEEIRGWKKPFGSYKMVEFAQCLSEGRNSRNGNSGSEEDNKGRIY